MVAKYCGMIGFATQKEVTPGVWEDVINESLYYGDVVTLNRRMVGAEFLNDNLTVGNSLSIVADPYALRNFAAMRYAELAGVRWKVMEVTVQSPRLLLRLGDKYNGPEARSSQDPGTNTGVY